MSRTLKPHKDLPQDRLASTDLQGNRVYIHPADVRGVWRNRRQLVHLILLFVFLLLPWVKVGGHQAVLLDVVHRRFALFGVTFWAHDAPMVFFVLLGLVLTLLFITAVWGRAWCGWGCPQTVFTEVFFRRIERFVEGDAQQRRVLDDSPFNLDKFIKKATKWLLFTVAALVISHSFLAYFVGTEHLGQMIRLSPLDNWGTFLFMSAVSAVILFDFGWFREQFCVIMCPYGRLQSVLMDNRSMVVGYDEARGEPRKGLVQSSDGKAGDCINCMRCVQVCPTGIDIRRGMQQLECIACTACIDACDDIMVKVNKPKGLIKYFNAHKVPTPRGVLYLALLVVIIGVLFAVLNGRKDIDVTVLRAKDAPYTKVSDTQYANRFTLHIANTSFEDKVLTLVSTENGVSLKASNLTDSVPAGRDVRLEVFVLFDSALLKSGSYVAPLQLIDTKGQTLWAEGVRVVGPFN